MMNQDNQALKVALAAAQELPPKLQRQLTERMMTAIKSEANLTVVYLERISPTKQRRLEKLMDKNKWEDHFRWNQNWQKLIGRTPIGRATIASLDINAKLLQQARPYWRLVGLIP